MSWQKIYVLSKKWHKLVLWVVVVLGSWMMLSGELMHRELGGDWIPFSPRAMLVVRFWHNAVSQWFFVVFGLQMVTGVVMWGVPKLLARQRAKSGNTEEK